MADLPLFHLTVLTPAKVIFDGDIRYVYVPGGAGDFGVLRDHAPVIASLKPGPVEIQPASGGTFRFTTAHPGFFEVVKNKASILLDAGEAAVFSKT
jgi:F-type H+-transporting ATPase subunit epsilon